MAQRRGTKASRSSLTLARRSASAISGRVGRIYAHLESGRVSDAQAEARSALARFHDKAAPEAVLAVCLEAALPRIAQSLQADEELYDDCVAAAERSGSTIEPARVASAGVYLRSVRDGFRTQKVELTDRLVAGTATPWDLEWAVSAAHALRNSAWLSDIRQRLDDDQTWDVRFNALVTAQRAVAHDPRALWQHEFDRRKPWDPGTLTLADATTETLAVLIQEAASYGLKREARWLLNRSLGLLHWHRSFPSVMRLVGDDLLDNDSDLGEAIERELVTFAFSSLAGTQVKEALALSVWLARNCRLPRVPSYLRARLSERDDLWKSHGCDVEGLFDADARTVAELAGVASPALSKDEAALVDALQQQRGEEAKALWESLLDSSLYFPEHAAAELLIEAIRRGDVALYDEVAWSVSQQWRTPDREQVLRRVLTAVLDSSPATRLAESAEDWPDLGIMEIRRHLVGLLGPRLALATEHAFCVSKPLAWQLIRGALKFAEPQAANLTTMAVANGDLESAVSFLVKPLLIGVHAHNAPMWARYSPSGYPIVLGVKFTEFERWPEPY